MLLDQVLCASEFQRNQTATSHWMKVFVIDGPRKPAHKAVTGSLNLEKACTGEIIAHVWQQSEATQAANLSRRSQVIML
jgi:hypothetical protein